MTRFTDSPYERLMTQKPNERRAAVNPPSAFPPGHPCLGCPYGRNAPCLGVCYQKLMGRRGKSDADNFMR